MQYDLESRLLLFSKSIIVLIKQIERMYINANIISQLLRSGTSIGANYREANGSISKKEFTHKIYICRKEAKETIYRLDLLGEVIHREGIYNNICQEAKEISLIFNKIATKLTKG